ncbi:hypothetical protein AKJ56_00985 [candidate division MSBL1 archaeon SCGC-AAA382N08]|uniref:Peptidase C1A papain C-terminal domain-containing protein n=1 Tax=candidate division MSBL1 archaeon SCGC-AAA382N08 TaxID=1698285 RepID=A0A133VQ65_9EURY|nr:hypothetical protein AKJ56_00985 [candidate division MSBL1 archaeon SCGC-AAA382N08]
MISKKKKNFIMDSSLGALKDKKDKRDFRLSGIQKDTAPPTSFALKDKFDVKNQWSRPSCTSQAQSHHKERQENVEIGARPIMAWTKDLENNTNQGAYTRNTFKVVNNIGCCKEKLCTEPGSNLSWGKYININKIPNKCRKQADEHKSKSYWRVDKSINKIKQAIYQNNNSVVMSMAWYNEFNNPNKDGMLPDYDKNGRYGGHAVECKGWDDGKKAFLMKNSWGASWGPISGYFYLPYSYIKDLVWDIWCSLDIPTELPVDNRYGRDRTWSSYLSEKSMAFNPWLRKKIKRAPNNREIKGLVYGHHSYENVFEGAINDKWLHITYPEYLKRQKEGKVD